ncbi:MAG: hypothetical protein HY589_01800, partial [Candidatus Omnitrophica bacterium]|nr:hypothetical protein [Candidatus Omnitrophota bacterium]
GKTYSGVFKLKNSSDFAVDISLSADKYRYVFSSGAIPPADGKKFLPSCQSWFEFEKKILKLNPGESGEAKFLIKVPGDIKEEHLCAILFDEKRALKEIRPKTPEGNIQIQFTPRFSVPVYISVKDSGIIKGEIREIAVHEESQKGGVILNIVFENSGNTHVRPFGTLVIFNQDGDVIKNLPIGKSLPVFPGYREVIPVICPKIPHGKYSAIATIEISKDNIVQKKTTFDLKPR